MSDAAGLVDGDTLYLLMRQATEADLPVICARLAAKHITVEPLAARMLWPCCSASRPLTTVRGRPLDLACRFTVPAISSCAGVFGAVTLMKLGLLPVRGHMLAVMVLVPLWGPLLVVLLSVRSAVFGDDLKDATLEALRINDDMHRSMLVQGREGDDGVVPLEEALIVNDPGDRRRLMLSMLTEDPDAYLAQLQAAKLNDDVEVAHYAATVGSFKESDLKLQQLERAFRPIRVCKTLTPTVTTWARILRPAWPRAAWLKFSASSILGCCTSLCARGRACPACSFMPRRWPMPVS